MKLITLWEPWATLMAIGAKKIETRSWYTDYQGWIAIHAAKHFTAEEDFLTWTSPFREALQSADVPSLPYRSGRRFQFSFGCILAIARLSACIRTGGLTAASPHILGPGGELPLPAVHRYSQLMTRQEYAFGNYEPGRYGLVTEKPFKLPTPIPFKSKQGKLLDVPPEVVAQIRKQWEDGHEPRP